jgi:PLAT/LH2 domain
MGGCSDDAQDAKIAVQIQNEQRHNPEEDLAPHFNVDLLRTLFSRGRRMTTETAKITSEQSTPPPEEPLTSGFRPSVESQAAIEAATVYQVAVYTGNVPGAGTDGDVRLWVDGTLGRTGWLYLDNTEDNFERNKTDYFYFNLANLGALTSAWVHFNPGGGGSSAWFLSTVTVNGRTFSYYNWLVARGTVRLNPA